MATNFHLVLEPYVKVTNMESQNGGHCPNFPALRKFFLLPTTVQVIGGGPRWNGRASGMNVVIGGMRWAGHWEESGVVTEGKRESNWAMSGGKVAIGGGVVEGIEGEGEGDERYGEGGVAEWTGREKWELDEEKMTGPLLQSMWRDFFERKSIPKIGWLTFVCKQFWVKEW
jgi:hypothetical protein